MRTTGTAPVWNSNV